MRKTLSLNGRFYRTVVAAAFVVFSIMLALSVLTTYLASRRTYSDTLLEKAQYQLDQVVANIRTYGIQTVYLRNNIHMVEVLLGTGDSALEQELLEKSVADEIGSAMGQLDIFIGAALQSNEGTFFLKKTDLVDFSAQTRQLLHVENMDFSAKKYVVSFCEYNNQSFLAITSPVMDANDKRVGYFHLFFNHMIYALPQVNARQECLLLSDNRVICCGSCRGLQGYTQVAGGSKGLLQTIQKTGIGCEKNGIVFYNDATGESMMGAVIQDEAYPLTMVMAVNVLDMSRSILPFTVLQCIISLLLFGLLLFVVYLIFKRTTKPVSDMIEQCSQLAGGDDSVEIEAGQDKELNKLANAFNGYRKKLELAAYADPLLKIGTRYKYLRDGETLIADPAVETLSIFLIDIQEFGKYNDVFSMDVGDQILHRVAKRLAQIFGTRLYRINGDVFMGVLLQDVQTEQMAERIHLSLQEKICIGQSEFDLKCRVGIVCYPEHGETAAALLEKVQSALHQAKLSSHTQTVHYNHKMIEAVRHEEEILNLLRRSMADSTLEVWYQPIYHLAAKRYLSAEALLRLKDDSGQYIAPFHVILIAEKNNMVDLVGDYVLEHTCALLKKLEQVQSSVDYIQVNLSVQQLAQNNYASKALALIRRTGVNPSRLGMEVTETMVIHSFFNAVETLEELRRQGIRIAMDDFGSGYSGINYLAKLPIDILKLDRELVIQAGESAEQFAFVQTVVQLAKIKKMRAVAEGVETEEMLERMIACGVDCIQGYYFSKPLSQVEFLNFIEQKAECAL